MLPTFIVHLVAFSSIRLIIAIEVRPNVIASAKVVKQLIVLVVLKVCFDFPSDFSSPHTDFLLLVQK